MLLKIPSNVDKRREDLKMFLLKRQGLAELLLNDVIRSGEIIITIFESLYIYIRRLRIHNNLRVIISTIDELSYTGCN